MLVSLWERNLRDMKVSQLSTRVRPKNLIHVFYLLHYSEEYDLLEALQTRLALHPLTAPLLGNNHAQYRGQGCPVSSSSPSTFEFSFRSKSANFESRFLFCFDKNEAEKLTVQYALDLGQAGVRQVLDGDMLGQFLELTNAQQQMILAQDPIQSRMLRVLGKNFPIERVLGLFERIHNYLA